MRNIFTKYHSYLIYLLFVTFVVLYQRVNAQNMQVTPLNANRFQPATNIHHIQEDEDGYYWYATEAGLWRDNGYQTDAFRTDYEHPDFWKSNEMLDIVVGKDEKVWVATTGGLYYINKKNCKLTEIKDKAIPSTHINSLSITNDSNIWVAAGKDIVRLSPKGEVVKTYKAQNEGDGYKYVNRVFSDSRNNLWMTECRGGLLRYDTKADKFMRCEWPEDCEPHGGMYEDPTHGCFWISTWGKGIVKYVPIGTAYKGEITFQPCTFDQNSSRGWCISMQGCGRTIWCSSMDGLYAYDITDEGILTPRPLDRIMPKGKKIFADLTKDKDDNILVSSYSPRSFILHPQKDNIQKFSVSSLLADNDMQMVAMDLTRDADGFVWLWHLRYGVVLFNPATGEHSKTQDLLEWNLSYTLLEKRKNAPGVWTSEGKTLYCLWHEGMQIHAKAIAELHVEPISLYDDGKGRLWISALKGIYCYNIQSGKTELVYKTTDRVQKMQLSDDGKRLFFILNSKGYGSVEIKSKKEFYFSDRTFTDFTLLENGNVWSSTSFGTVVHHNINSLESEEIKLANGDAIISLTFDEAGHLWILTNQYVEECSLDLKTRRTFFANDPDINIDYFTFMRYIDGCMYIGGAGGYCVLKANNDFKVKAAKHRPDFSSVVIDGKKTILGTETEDVVLTHDNINLEVNFSSFNHIDPHSISFAYSLQKKGSKEENWIELPAGQATVYLSGLSKGKYTLSIKATDDYGNWGDDIATLGIIREPAWWETWWMTLGYILWGGISIAIVLHVYYRNKMQKSQIQKLVTLAQELRHSQAKEIALTGEKENSQETAEQNGQQEDVPQLSKANAQFIRKAKDMVEKNIKNMNYTTEQFASDLCMSRMSLYRKLQAITGQTPTEFMKMIRLHAAAEMLKSSDMTVTEVANRVGFATPSYFTKCFKDAFGVLPNEYKKS